MSSGLQRRWSCLCQVHFSCALRLFCTPHETDWFIHGCPNAVPIFTNHFMDLALLTFSHDYHDQSLINQACFCRIMFFRRLNIFGCCPESPPFWLPDGIYCSSPAWFLYRPFPPTFVSSENCFTWWFTNIGESLYRMARRIFDLEGYPRIEGSVVSSRGLAISYGLTWSLW